MAAEKEYLAMEEAALFIGMKRATIYNYMNDLNIKTHRFGRNRHRYLAMDDVKRIKQYKENPWKVKDEDQ